MKIKQNNQKGFTIIEVLIVLAIAGLIMLIVFLAVPALQRNQRNNSRASEASRIATAVSNFVTNNGGKLPRNDSQANWDADAAKIIDDAGELNQFTGLGAASPLGTAAATKFSVATAGAGTPAALGNIANAMQLVKGGVCTNPGGGATNAGANSRSLALQYTFESKSDGTYSGICINI